jgi:hypothetical protein
MRMVKSNQRSEEVFSSDNTLSLAGVKVGNLGIRRRLQLAVRINIWN